MLNCHAILNNVIKTTHVSTFTEIPKGSLIYWIILQNSEHIITDNLITSTDNYLWLIKFPQLIWCTNSNSWCDSSKQIERNLKIQFYSLPVRKFIEQNALFSDRFVLLMICLKWRKLRYILAKTIAQSFSSGFGHVYWRSP